VTGGSPEENISVALLPEKEGMFMFQHHNYQVSSPRRGSKVVRRYSDFVWLLVSIGGFFISSPSECWKDLQVENVPRLVDH
jgi:hypothetical protein